MNNKILLLVLTCVHFNISSERPEAPPAHEVLRAMADSGTAVATLPSPTDIQIHSSSRNRWTVGVLAFLGLFYFCWKKISKKNTRTKLTPMIATAYCQEAPIAIEEEEKRELRLEPKDNGDDAKKMLAFIALLTAGTGTMLQKAEAAAPSDDDIEHEFGPELDEETDPEKDPVATPQPPNKPKIISGLRLSDWLHWNSEYTPPTTDVPTPSRPQPPVDLPFRARPSVTPQLEGGGATRQSAPRPQMERGDAAGQLASSATPPQIGGYPPQLLLENGSTDPRIHLSEEQIQELLRLQQAMGIFLETQVPPLRPSGPGLHLANLDPEQPLRLYEARNRRLQQAFQDYSRSRAPEEPPRLVELDPERPPTPPAQEGAPAHPPLRRSNSTHDLFGLEGFAQSVDYDGNSSDEEDTTPRRHEDGDAEESPAGPSGQNTRETRPRSLSMRQLSYSRPEPREPLPSFPTLKRRQRYRDLTPFLPVVKLNRPGNYKEYTSHNYKAWACQHDIYEAARRAHDTVSTKIARSKDLQHINGTYSDRVKRGTVAAGSWLNSAASASPDAKKAQAVGPRGGRRSNMETADLTRFQKTYTALLTDRLEIEKEHGTTPQQLEDLQREGRIIQGQITSLESQRDPLLSTRIKAVHQKFVTNQAKIVPLEEKMEEYKANSKAADTKLKNLVTEKINQVWEGVAEEKRK